jgi:hypothetical protein
LYRLGRESDTNCFRLGEKTQRLVTTFATNTAILDTAERRPQITQQPAIDPDRAALQLFGNAVGSGQILRPQ